MAKEELTGWRKALNRSYGLLLMAGSSLTFSIVSLLVSLLVRAARAASTPAAAPPHVCVRGFDFVQVTDFPVYQIVAIRYVDPPLRLPPCPLVAGGTPLTLLLCCLSFA